MNAATYKGIFILVGVMLLIGVAAMPYGYYQFLRWLVAIGGAMLIQRALKVKQPGWSVIGGLAILLWFPMFGVTFDKGTWAVFDFVFGAGFIAAGMLLRGKSRV